MKTGKRLSLIVILKISNLGFSFMAKRRLITINTTVRLREDLGIESVSRNGASWQVLMMINNVKTYIGCYDTEEEGALVYDIVSILFKQRKARTNLSYSKLKLLDLLSYYDHDSKHFTSIIPQRYIQELQTGSFM